MRAQPEAVYVCVCLCAGEGKVGTKVSVEILVVLKLSTISNYVDTVIAPQSKRKRLKKKQEIQKDLPFSKTNVETCGRESFLNP